MRFRESLGVALIVFMGQDRVRRPSHCVCERETHIQTYKKCRIVDLTYPLEING
ncbi:hypothetical protein BRADI_2g52823v3 [Brachypodium distachyon]|uniref:Uncharacterized protein n=1 Tax=Brachypodium distachyon TaxID=15368 RepID=A0A2K2DFI9_BRADI|nr:hypothetical protein BRADI_2g52823v3 [Brachypodium distachyon]PNT73056.1 hypothetical protein BRADI_2g52823v3 [Brachypodium distachyon]